ncbi:UV excision repair protein RAD23 [Carpediemonas membranifera]|uniref:UV excision repair protein RAD23 n=1 Tax=Carpediemonas membranifera TaxID=201153 RepID=A0A8J6E0M2_9EUKA|nr:UV excision repair protein RAD23 [Carpediemonas membranifera]|eukprot:KAG9395304.1 UV excision repair protein RAD23 [Carpediemonas membranifera]
MTNEYIRPSSPIGYGKDHTELDDSTYERLKAKWAAKLATSPGTPHPVSPERTPSTSPSARRNLGFNDVSFTSPARSLSEASSPARTASSKPKSPILQAATRTMDRMDMAPAPRLPQTAMTTPPDIVGPGFHEAMEGIMARLSSLELRTAQVGREVHKPEYKQEYSRPESSVPLRPAPVSRPAPQPAVFVSRQHLFFGCGTQPVIKRLRLRNSDPAQGVSVSLTVDRRTHSATASFPPFTVTSGRAIHLGPLETATVEVTWRPPAPVRSGRLEDFFCHAKLVIDAAGAAYQVPLLAVPGQPQVVVGRTAVFSGDSQLYGSVELENKGTAPAFLQFEHGAVPESPVVMPGATVMCKVRGTAGQDRIFEYRYETGSEPLRVLAAQAGVNDCPALSRQEPPAMLSRVALTAEEVEPFFRAGLSAVVGHALIAKGK